MKRGEIYYIRSTHQEEGSEQRADRPAVIVSNNKNNEHSETVEVVYMTTRPKNDLPTHVFTRSALSPSTILCEQVCTVSKSRAGTLIGKLTDTELQALDIALMISLGIDFGPSEKPSPADCHGVIPAAEELTEIPEQPEPNIELIKAQTERDVYRDLYRELLTHLKGDTEA